MGETAEGMVTLLSEKLPFCPAWIFRWRLESS